MLKNCSYCLGRFPRQWQKTNYWSAFDIFDTGFESRTFIRQTCFCFRGVSEHRNFVIESSSNAFRCFFLFTRWSKKRNAWKCLSPQSFKYLSTTVSKQLWTLQFSLSVIHFDNFSSKPRNFHTSKVWTKWLVQTSRLFLKVLIIFCWKFDYAMREWLTEKVKNSQCLVYKCYNFEVCIFCAFRFFWFNTTLFLVGAFIDERALLLQSLVSFLFLKTDSKRRNFRSVCSTKRIPGKRI